MEECWLLRWDGNRLHQNRSPHTKVAVKELMAYSTNQHYSRSVPGRIYIHRSGINCDEISKLVYLQTGARFPSACS